jgi:hypothetical protein
MGKKSNNLRKRNPRILGKSAIDNSLRKTSRKKSQKKSQHKSSQKKSQQKKTKKKSTKKIAKQPKTYSYITELLKGGGTLNNLRESQFSRTSGAYM